MDALLLRKHFPLLKALYSAVVMADVTPLDHYYTDGLATGASFKLTFDNGPTVYVYSDGQYRGGSKLLKPIMDKWIDDVKGLLDADP